MYILDRKTSRNIQTCFEGAEDLADGQLWDGVVLKCSEKSGNFILWGLAAAECAGSLRSFMRRGIK